jgi:archaellum component FlaF (FlaF/FlaG flagellin family)
MNNVVGKLLKSNFMRGLYSAILLIAILVSISFLSVKTANKPDPKDIVHNIDECYETIMFTELENSNSVVVMDNNYSNQRLNIIARNIEATSISIDGNTVVIKGENEVNSFIFPEECKVPNVVSHKKDKIKKYN